MASVVLLDARHVGQRRRGQRRAGQQGIGAHAPGPVGPDWPAATLLDGPEDFLGGLRAEQAWEKAHHLAYALGQAHGEGQVMRPSCGADWGEGETGQACPLRDGWARARPCPVCDGACGAVWRRAVQDSPDSGRGVWIGTCAAPRSDPAAHPPSSPSRRT